MDYDSLILKYPALSIFNESVLIEILNKRNIWIKDCTIQIVPSEYINSINYYLVKHVQTEERYEVVYMKWGDVVSELWTKDTLLKYMSNDILNNPESFSSDCYRVCDVIDKGVEKKFKLTSSRLEYKLDMIFRDSVAIKVIEKTIYDVV